MLRQNWLLEKLRRSEFCIGTWITIPSAVALDVICSTGPDFVVVDMEHSPTGFETAQLMAVTCESRGVSPVLRPSSLLESQIVRGLEIGMHAIQVPNISSAPMIESMVRFARYQPMGSKGLSPYTRACDYSAANAGSIVREANQNTLLIAQVEGREGIENLDAILEVGGIDACFLGMFDLSNFLGIPGQLEDSRLRSLFSELARKINDRGIVVGSISNDESQLRFLMGAGVRYITHSADCEILGNAYRKVFGASERAKRRQADEARN